MTQLACLKVQCLYRAQIHIYISYHWDLLSRRSKYVKSTVFAFPLLRCARFQRCFFALCNEFSLIIQFFAFRALSTFVNSENYPRNTVWPWECTRIVWKHDSACVVLLGSSYFKMTCYWLWIQLLVFALLFEEAETINFLSCEQFSFQLLVWATLFTNRKLQWIALSCTFILLEAYHPGRQLPLAWLSPRISCFGQ